MKRFVILTVLWAAGAFASLSFAQSKPEVPFEASIHRLTQYLDLQPCQVEEVARINEFFIRKQKESLYGNGSRCQPDMETALFGNLKLMKNVLSEEQYRQYLVLLNVTHNNNKYLYQDYGMTDVYLAEQED